MTKLEQVCNALGWQGGTIHQARQALLAMPRDLTRRRYGSQTFTWVRVVLPDHSTIDLGDPWPCITPKRAEVERAIMEVL